MFPCTSALRAKRTGCFLLNFLSQLWASLSSPPERFETRCNHNSCCFHTSNCPAHPLSRRATNAPLLPSHLHSVLLWKCAYFSQLERLVASPVRLFNFSTVWCMKSISTLWKVCPCCFSLGLFTATQIRPESNLNGLFGFRLSTVLWRVSCSTHVIWLFMKH